MMTLLDVLGAVSRLDLECTDARAQFSGRYLARSEGLEELRS